MYFLGLTLKPFSKTFFKEYTGISSPYEEPENPDLTIETEKYDIKTSVQKVLELIDDRKFIAID